MTDQTQSIENSRIIGGRLIRAFYLANFTMTFIIIAVYLFGLRVPPINGTYLSDPAALGLGYAIVLGIWILLDMLNVVANTYILSSIFEGIEIRWYDLGLACFGGLVLFAAWRTELANIAIWVLAGLIFLNGIVFFLASLTESRRRRAEEQRRWEQAQYGADESGDTRGDESTDAFQGDDINGNDTTPSELIPDSEATGTVDDNNTATNSPETDQVDENNNTATDSPETDQADENIDTLSNA